jgi:hypothetical protein
MVTEATSALSGILAGAPHFAGVFWRLTVANFPPVFVPNVRVDHHVAAVEAVDTVAFASGDPIFLAGFHIEII